MTTRTQKSEHSAAHDAVVTGYVLTFLIAVMTGTWVRAGIGFEFAFYAATSVAATISAMNIVRYRHVRRVAIFHAAPLFVLATFMMMLAILASLNLLQR